MDHLKTSGEIRSALFAGEITLPQLVHYYLEKIEVKKALNAFVEVYAEEALREAERIQQKIEAKTAGRLAGMVLSLKDNIAHQDHGLSASSKMLEGYISPFSATLTERLLAEDALIIGRTNCDEFAMGASNETSYFGPVRNAGNPEKVSGGSSGGAAVAVQAGLCTASIGTDTGGSVRQPASFCGVVGFKPTYGRISRWGLIAFGSSFDQAGPITNDIDDAELLYGIMQGPDGRDSTLTQKKEGEKGSSSGKRVAVLQGILEGDGIDHAIQQKMNAFVTKLREDGYTVDEVPFPLIDYLVPAYYILAMAEASSNLSRYDGIRYGFRDESAATLDEMYKKSRSAGFGREVKRRIMLGTFVLSAGYYDAYYAKAQKVRRLITEETDKILQEYDVLITPTAPTAAFSIGEKIADPVKMYLSDVFTVQASLTGLPAISIPLGNNEENMAFGLQLLGQRFEEKKLLAMSRNFSELNADQYLGKANS
ncbi:MAG: Asp-tRNA(Asn)/Glu-tRNA(Gln) amidotransferase subunit GatA [Mucilaginibacter polytrichastri]|nr:Asp-tRNA(Asn)/Glu-tRNA(Gln) amidotransferase subunit GatA [Mucilaginibacter polytrichastri]